jgi:hypothetical protein
MNPRFFANPILQFQTTILTFTSPEIGPATSFNIVHLVMVGGLGRALLVFKWAGSQGAARLAAYFD